MSVQLEAFGRSVKRCSGPCGHVKFEDEFWADTKQADGKASRCIACTKQAREERRIAQAGGAPLPTITDERRQQLSENAKRMHAVGLFGGPEYGRLGGRPRNIRMTDAVINHFRQTPQVELIVRAYESNLRSNNKTNRLRAAEALLSMEARDEDLKAKLRGAGKRPEDLSPEELQELVEQGVMAMIERGEIDVSAFDIELPPGAVQDVAPCRM